MANTLHGLNIIFTWHPSCMCGACACACVWMLCVARAAAANSRPVPARLQVHLRRAALTGPQMRVLHDLCLLCPSPCTRTVQFTRARNRETWSFVKQWRSGLRFGAVAQWLALRTRRVDPPRQHMLGWPSQVSSIPRGSRACVGRGQPY